MLTILPLCLCKPFSLPEQSLQMALDDSHEKCMSQKTHLFKSSALLDCLLLSLPNQDFKWLIVVFVCTD